MIIFQIKKINKKWINQNQQITKSMNINLIYKLLMIKIYQQKICQLEKIENKV